MDMVTLNGHGHIKRTCSRAVSCCFRVRWTWSRDYSAYFRVRWTWSRKKLIINFSPCSELVGCFSTSSDQFKSVKPTGIFHYLQLTYSLLRVF